MRQRYRRDIALRTIGAIFGSYALAAALAFALARLLPLADSEAVIAANMSGVLLMPVVVLWMFAATSASRAWSGLLAGLGLCALVATLVT